MITEEKRALPSRGVWDNRCVIRPYEDRDLNDALEAWYLASLEAHSFLDEEFFNNERILLAEQWLPASDTSVLEVEGEVVGFMSLVGDEVGGIFVAPSHQNRGVGRALIDHAAASHSHLEVEVFEANAIGRRFYEAYGFTLIDRLVDETTGFPLLRLRIDLPPLDTRGGQSRP